MIKRVKAAPVTWSLIAANVLVFLLETAAGGSTSVRVAVTFGAQYLPFVMAGEYYRLFASMFLHFGLIHLACNMFSLAGIGPGIERIYGKVRFVVVYLGAGLIGNLLTLAIESRFRPDDPSLSAGASGAVFGLLGAYAALLLIPQMRRVISARGIVITLILNLAYGLTYTNVNMAAHAGGFVGGFAIAAAMIVFIRFRRSGTGTAQSENEAHYV